MADTGAFLNQGKFWKERKNSLLVSNNQIPCLEICVTSTSKVSAPSISDFIFMLLDQSNRGLKVRTSQTIVLSQFDRRLHPVFCFTVTAVNVNVHSRFFAREEKEAKT